MIKFIFEKLIQKKWMVLSLLAGTVLFISVILLNPLYINGALQKMIQQRMEIQEIETLNPPMLSVYDAKMDNYDRNFNELCRELKDEVGAYFDAIPVPVSNEVWAYKSALLNVFSNYKPAEQTLLVDFRYYSDLFNHVTIINGTEPKEYEAGDAYVEAAVSQSTMQKNSFVLGEELSLNIIKDENGQMIPIKIVGVFEKEEGNSYFIETDLYQFSCFIKENGFNQVIGPSISNSKTYYPITLYAYRIYDYNKVKINLVHDIIEICNENDNEYLFYNFKDILEKYQKDSVKIKTTMMILQIPTIALLALFIYMVASKMISMEENEISMLKSRGVSGMKIFNVYLFQSVIITLFSAIISIPLGILLAKILGQANSFMEFVSRKSIPVVFRPSMLIYLFIAVFFCILVMTIPVISKCRATIVESKRNKSKNRNPFWKKFYLDIIGLAISGYLYYNYYSKLDVMKENIQNGQSVDPLLFLASSFFILSAALLFLRIIPLITVLIYKIGYKKWSIAAYTAFLQNIRNRNKQAFVTLFLIVTVALGIFNANTARTINANEELNVYYQTGADIVLKEKFKSNYLAIKRQISLNGDKYQADDLFYIEPENYKYNQIEEYIEKQTKVYREDNVSVIAGGNTIDNGRLTLMGINTKEFGEIAYMPDGITPHHWYNELNAMALNPNGVIISQNLANKIGLQIGDNITYNHMDVFNRKTGTQSAEIVGIMEYFPGFVNSKTYENADGTFSNEDHYLVVANFDVMTTRLGSMPYERWIKNKNSNSYIYEFSEENRIQYDSFADAKNTMIKIKNDPMFQETNGFLTIGFLVSLMICAVGFLIFQIMGMKERELNFGVYRAMGLSLKEVNKMLMLEQLMSSLPAILSGMLIGIIATKLYIPFIVIAYQSDIYKTLPTELIVNAKDMIQLSICLLLVFICCMFIIIRNVKQLKIAQALKLGEE